jgi:hypothetical protein
MSRRNSERQLNRPPAAEATSRGVMLLVWRRCPVCGWETEGIERQGANPLCQRCQTPMEQQAVAPADSQKTTDLSTSGEREQKSKGPLVQSRKQPKPRK